MGSTGSEHRASPPTGAGTGLRTRIELWLAVVFMALAFGAGIAVRAISEPSQASVAVTTTDQTTGQITLAPPLTDAQIQQGLPPGHPDLSGGADTGSGKSNKGSKASGNGSTSSSGTP
jgi:hypothetical protein